MFDDVSDVAVLAQNSIDYKNRRTVRLYASTPFKEVCYQRFRPLLLLSLTWTVPSSQLKERCSSI
eukprot:3824876-Amphidinium_carterae.1